MSILIKSFSPPNKHSATAFESSVFPTPVGPKNRNEPIGLFGSLSPTLPLLIAFATASTASFCPITLSCNVFSKFLSFSFSVLFILSVGIPVEEEITSAIFSSLIVTIIFVFLFFHFDSSFSSFSCNFPSLSLSSAAFSNF